MTKQEMLMKKETLKQRLGVDPESIKKLSDLDVPEGFEGSEYLKIDEIKGKEIIIKQVHKFKQKSNYSKTGKKVAKGKGEEIDSMLILALELPDLKLIRFMTSSSVVQDIILKHEKKLPFLCMLEKVKKYWVLR